jgi:hypothetical protein
LERSGSVRASTISTLARPAKVHHVLTPVSSHSSPSLTALVVMAALAGVTIRGGPRARDRRIEAAVASVADYERRRTTTKRRSIR